MRVVVAGTVSHPLFLSFQKSLMIIAFLNEVPEALLENGKLPKRHLRIASEYVELASQWIKANDVDAEIIRYSPFRDCSFAVNMSSFTHLFCLGPLGVLKCSPLMTPK